jgi:hypothetical protein
MKHEEPIAKAHREEIEAKLQEAKAKLNELDATAKERKAKAVIEAITALRVRREEIQARMRELGSAGEAKASQVEAEIDARVADFLAAISKLGDKLRSQSATAKQGQG